MSKKYWTEESLTKEKLTLKKEGYSKKEINNATDDYKIHLCSNILLHHFVALTLLIVVMMLLVFQLFFYK